MLLWRNHRANNCQHSALRKKNSSANNTRILPQVTTQVTQVTQVFNTRSRPTTPLRIAPRRSAPQPCIMPARTRNQLVATMRTAQEARSWWA